jgi:prepilin-type N-terminal cleavage/methylation domain-containing protein
MRQGGVTLIELLVVVAVAGILVIALGFEFMGWMRRYNVESQIKTMQTDLMYARQRAMGNSVQYVVQFPVDKKSYLICEDSNGNYACDAPVETTTSISRALSKNGLKYQMNSDLGVAALLMNIKGMVQLSTGGVISDINSSAPNNIWLLNPDTGDPYTGLDAPKVDYDCISLSATRIGAGKYNGAACVVK